MTASKLSHKLDDQLFFLFVPLPVSICYSCAFPVRIFSETIHHAVPQQKTRRANFFVRFHNEQRLIFTGVISVGSNISVSITNGDDIAAIETPTAAVAVQQVSAEPLEYCPEPIELANNAGPQMRHEIGLVNAPVIMGTPAAAGEDEIRSPSVTSDLPVSAAEPKHDGSGESDAKMNRGFIGCRPRLWCSMPNIAIHYTDKVFYKTTEIECIAQMPVSPYSLAVSSTTAVTEPTEITPVKIKRCSLWKRTKKFARRVFCCGTA